jgi:hypothetical protein
MKQLKKWYRADYQGEDVVTDLVHQNQNWDITKEFIPNSVFNNQISNQAVVIGNGITRSEFKIDVVMNHFGGLLGRQKLQTYGCNAFYRDHTPDFLVVTGDDATIVTEIANSGYCDNHVVYASAKEILNHPNKFYMIPQDPGWNAGSMAAYLAAFDGHEKVYLLGFDGQDTAHYNYNVYAGTNGYQPERNAPAPYADFLDATMSQIFDVYSDVDFVRVMPNEFYSIPEEWRYKTNLRQISFRQFVYEADL